MPSGSTTSNPSTDPWSEPYLNKRKPPALVATFPPIWQLSPRGYCPGDLSPFQIVHIPALCAEVQRHDVIMRGQVFRQRFKNAPRVGHQYPCMTKLKSTHCVKPTVSYLRRDHMNESYSYLPDSVLPHLSQVRFRRPSQYFRLEEQPRCDVRGTI